MRGPETVRMTVAYHGAGFSGFANNPGVRTVQQELEGALEKILRIRVELTAAGRTDRGVHAQGQVVSWRSTSDRLDVTRLAQSLNQLLAPEIAVSDVEVVDDDFDARFSAVGRTYHYRVLNRLVHDPLLEGMVWHVREPLDIDAMNVAARHLVGTHDFTSLCRRPKSNPDAILVRRVASAQWVQERPGLLRFEVSGKSFCHQQVRAMVGLLVSIGQRRRPPDAVVEVLAARDRRSSPSTAPARGLTLIEVSYSS